MNAAPDAIVFDLFGTLVFFDDDRLPRLAVAGRSVVMTVPALPLLLAEVAPDVEVGAFLACLREVGAELFQHKRRLGIEIATAVRFEQALSRCGVDEAVATPAASRMAREHMDSLARAVVVPPGRPQLLRHLAGSHRLALVSNFDDGPTARRVLREAGLDSLLEAIVISAEEGIRKPSAAIFHRACGALGLAPGRCLYVGDTLVEDIEGATGAGLPSVWVTAAPGEPSAALGHVADVSGLPAWLQARYAAGG